VPIKAQNTLEILKYLKEKCFEFLASPFFYHFFFSYLIFKNPPFFFRYPSNTKANPTKRLSLYIQASFPQTTSKFFYK